MSAAAYKTKNRINYSSAKGYKAFKEKYPDSNITSQQYALVIRKSNALIASAILENPFGFKLPNNIGYIAVDKYQPKKGSRKPIDWITTNKLHKLTYLTNLHSFGWIYHLKFYKNPSKKNVDCYTFKPQKLLRIALAKRIKAGEEYEPLDRSFFSRRFSIDKIFKNKN